MAAANSKKELYIMGLGNPGREYEHTRHNTGRDAVMLSARTNKFPPFEFDKYLNALTSKANIGHKSVLLLLPETFVNNSGETLKKLKLIKKDIENNFLLVQDDLDLPVGAIKIVYNRGSGGHKGVESIIRAARTENFARLRLGIAKPAHLKKSQHKKEVVKIVIGKFTPLEMRTAKAAQKKAALAIETFARDGIAKTMNKFN